MRMHGAYFFHCRATVTNNSSNIYRKYFFILFNIIIQQCKHLHSAQWFLKWFANLANFISYWIPHQCQKVHHTQLGKRNRFDLVCAVIVCGCMCMCVRVRSAFLLHMPNETATRLSICLPLCHLGHFTLDKRQTYVSTFAWFFHHVPVFLTIVSHKTVFNWI